MTVAAIQETGLLKSLGVWLEGVSSGNPYIVTGIIGILQAIVDNVPLVASSMAMYEIIPGEIHYMVDGEFWQLLAYCAGVGGSMLIIGSAAGIATMGIEKMSFTWYLKKISWIALLGYLGGIATYWIIDMIAR